MLTSFGVGPLPAARAGDAAPIPAGRSAAARAQTGFGEQIEQLLGATTALFEGATVPGEAAPVAADTGSSARPSRRKDPADEQHAGDGGPILDPGAWLTLREAAPPRALLDGVARPEGFAARSGLDGATSEPGESDAFAADHAWAAGLAAGFLAAQPAPAAVHVVEGRVSAPIPADQNRPSSPLAPGPGAAFDYPDGGPVERVPPAGADHAWIERNAPVTPAAGRLEPGPNAPDRLAAPPVTGGMEPHPATAAENPLPPAPTADSQAGARSALPLAAEPRVHDRVAPVPDRVAPAPDRVPPIHDRVLAADEAVPVRSRTALRLAASRGEPAERPRPDVTRATGAAGNVAEDRLRIDPARHTSAAPAEPDRTTQPQPRGAELSGAQVLPLPASLDLSPAPAAVESPVEAAATSGLPADTDVPDQIVQSLRVLVTAGGGEARVHLRPEYLGEVTIHVVVEDGVVSAHLEADQPAVREWIERHEISLRQALGEHGLTLDALNVADGSSDESLDRGDGEPRDREAPERQRRPRRQADDDAPRFEVMV